MSNLTMDVEFECDHFHNDENRCGFVGNCPLQKHCANGLVSLNGCEFEFDYESRDPGSWECAPSGPSIDVGDGSFQGEDILTGLPADVLDNILDDLLESWEGHLDGEKADQMFSRYEDSINMDDDVHPYFDGH